MISAGDGQSVKKLKAYLPNAICVTYDTSETNSKVTQCKAKLPKVVDDALKLYPLKADYQRKAFANIVRRFSVAAVVFRTQIPFLSDGNFTSAEMYQAQAKHRKYILNPAGLKKINIYSPVDKKIHSVDYKGMVEIAAMIASKIKEDRGIVVPPPLMKEINLINKIFPKQWADHLVERVARLYLTSIKELKLSGADPKKINYDGVAKQIVQKVRRFAKKAIDGRAVLPTLKIDDATAKANYKKIKEDETQKFLKPFLWDMTDTFVLKAVLKKVGTPPKDVADISFRNATGIKAAIGKSKSHPLSTHELRQISKGTAIKSHFRLPEKIKQADFIREQTVKALKRLYPQSAGLMAASGTKYLENRNALDNVIGKMVVATIKGMKKTFKAHYASKSAQDMALRELEAREVIMKAGTKNPDYVKFEISLHKSTGGASQTTYIDLIVNGGSGNRTLRRAVAVRRYQDGKILLDKKFKDPKVRAEKTEKMKASLVKALKNLSLDDLLRSAVDGIKEDGSAKIKLAPKVFIKYAKTGWLGAQLKKLAGLANVKRPKANEGADSYVDIIDRSKFIFKDAVDSNKSELSTGGTLDPKKLQALAKALVDLIRKMQLDPKGDRTGTRWTKTGKGASFKKIKPAKVKEYYKKPLKNEEGKIIGHKWKTRMVQGFKVTGLDLPNRFGKGGSDFHFPKLFTAKLGKDMEGVLLGNLALGVTYMPGSGVTHYQIAQIGYQLQKGGFLLGFMAGAENIEGQTSDRFTRGSEGGPITNIPFSMSGPYAVSRYKAKLFMGYTGKTGNWTLTGKAAAGVLSSRPGIPGSVSRDLIDHNAVNATLSGSRMLGAMATFSAAFKDKKKDPVHEASLTLGVKGGKMTSAALRSNDGGDKSHWLDGAHVTAWLIGSYAYKKYFVAKAGIGYDKQMAGKLEHAAFTGMLRVPAGSQVSGSADITITPLHRMKIGGGYDLSVILNGGFATWKQKYDRLQVPNEAKETIGFASAELRLGTKNWGDFSIFAAMNYLTGSYTSYLVPDPRTNEVFKNIVDYNGSLAGGGLSWKIRGLRLSAGIFGRKIQSTKAAEDKTGISIVTTVAAPF